MKKSEILAQMLEDEKEYFAAEKRLAGYIEKMPLLKPGQIIHIPQLRKRMADDLYGVPVHIDEDRDAG